MLLDCHGLGAYLDQAHATQHDGLMVRSKLDVPEQNDDLLLLRVQEGLRGGTGACVCRDAAQPPMLPFTYRPCAVRHWRVLRR